MNAESGQSNFILLRIFAGIAALPLSGLAVSFVRTGFDLFWAGFILSFFAAASLCWWFAFRGHVALDRVLMLHALVGGVVIGGISFIAGFVGPMIFMPKSNQGPMLGIFITGPLGFAAGAVIGLIVGVVRHCRRR
jgi:hypothetical protein